MYDKWIAWLGQSRRRADLVALFLVVNVFYLINSLVGPLPHSLPIYASISLTYLVAQALLYHSVRHELRLKDMVFNVGLVMIFAYLFGGLV